MKKNVIKEIQAKSKEELVKMLKEYQDELKKIMIQFNSGKLRNVMLPKNRKKDIARILTAIHDKEGEQP